MSDVMLKAVQARAALCCDKCGERWQSRIFTVSSTWGDAERHAAPAFSAGWRVYVAARGRRTYCPDCAPTVPMRQVLP
jgi:hypothetical protein